MSSEEILELINKKVKEQSELNFLIDILKNSYIEQAKAERKSEMQLCYMFDFHKAWLEQSEKEKPEYDRFIFALKNFVFHDEFENIKLEELIINQCTFSLDFKFTYKKYDFNLLLPNYDGVKRFEEINDLNYQLAYYETPYCLETFKSYKTLKELGENIIKDLNNKINSIEGIAYV